MRNFLVPKWVRKYREVYRQKGFKALIKETPLRIIILIFFFYLIRDVILYVLIPFLVAKGLLS